MKFSSFCCAFFFLPFLAAFAGAKPDKTMPQPAAAPGAALLPPHSAELAAEVRGRDAGAGQPSIDVTQVSSSPPEQPSQAERIVRALEEAYPDRIGEVAFREAGPGLAGDWALQVYGEWFYYAEGRFLPASLRDRAAEYDPLPFYNYAAELPPWRLSTPEESARMREQTALRRARPAKRSPHFFDALWRSRNRNEAWDHVKQIRFLGSPILVHYSILTNLSLVEEQILRVSKTNPSVRRWIDSLKTAESWNWRDIALTESRSFHAYGAAVDLIPKSPGGLETYWVWTARTNSEWWNVPYSRRLHPPDEVIRAFESFGFIWGGKWRYFDTMHFEYRPEILVLSGIPRIDLRELR